jgi:uncharacterized protein YebE (UPF0316 family)
MSAEFMDTEFFNWVVLPVLIALARIMDVTVGTLRLIFVARGYKNLAPVLGFVEVIIWLVAISQIFQHLDNIMCYIGYGAGFAAGNYIGIHLAEKMSLGTVVIRIIAKKDTTDLINILREANYGVTTVDAEGKAGPVRIIFSIVKRKDLRDALELVNHHNPHAFYTIEEVQTVNEGYFRAQHARTGFITRLFPFVSMRK